MLPVFTAIGGLEGSCTRGTQQPSEELYDEYMKAYADSTDRADNAAPFRECMPEIHRRRSPPTNTTERR
jgi:hypothetical protein